MLFNLTTEIMENDSSTEKNTHNICKKSTVKSTNRVNSSEKEFHISEYTNSKLKREKSAFVISVFVVNLFLMY